MMIREITTPWYSAQYTMPLYQILEEYASKNLGIPLVEVHELPIQEIIEQSHNSLFDFDYPIWDEEYRAVFQTNFCNYFYTREINSETLVLFKQRLLTEMVIKMPYYNQIYESTTWMKKYNINPLDNTDYTETYSRDTTGTGSTEGTTNNTSKNEGYTDGVNSETPQGLLSGLDYATTANKNKAVNDATGTGEQTTSAKDENHEDYAYHKRGNIGVQTFADILNSNREAFLNVDMIVFLDLTELFMLIY